MRDIRYRHVEAALAELHRVEDKDRAAFKARIRNLRKVGVPALPEVGRGTQIIYTRQQVHELALGLELAQTGLDPLNISFVVQRMRRNLLKNAERILDAPEDADFHLGVELSNWGGALGEEPTLGAYLFPWTTFVEWAFGEAWHRSGRRIIVIRWGHVVREIDRMLDRLEING